MSTITAHAVRLQRDGRLVLTNTGRAPVVDVAVFGRDAHARPLRVADRQPIPVLAPGQSTDLTVEQAPADPWELAIAWRDRAGHRYESRCTTAVTRVGGRR